MKFYKGAQTESQVHSSSYAFVIDSVSAATL